MVAPLTVDDWPPAPIRTARLVLHAPESRDREAFLDLGTDDVVNAHLGGGRDRTALGREKAASRHALKAAEDALKEAKVMRRAQQQRLAKATERLTACQAENPPATEAPAPA